MFIETKDWAILTAVMVSNVGEICLWKRWKKTYRLCRGSKSLLLNKMDVSGDHGLLVVSLENCSTGK